MDTNNLLQMTFQFMGHTRYKEFYEQLQDEYQALEKEVISLQQQQEEITRKLQEKTTEKNQRWEYLQAMLSYFTSETVTIPVADQPVGKEPAAVTKPKATRPEPLIATAVFGQSYRQAPIGTPISTKADYPQLTLPLPEESRKHRQARPSSWGRKESYRKILEALGPDKHLSLKGLHYQIFGTTSRSKKGTEYHTNKSRVSSAVHQMLYRGLLASEVVAGQTLYFIKPSNDTEL